MLTGLSSHLARLERLLLVALLALLVALILFNVVTRAADMAIYWVDELAIYTMIWLVFVGASHALRARRHVQVTLLTHLLSERLRRPVAVGIDVLVCLFCVFSLWLAWIWYDPAALAAAGFDREVFTSRTFNFIYEEPTSTIGLRKLWIWLVMPWFALTASVHAGANVIGDPAADSSLESA